MSFAELIPIAIKLSIVLLVFALGLHADWRDATSVFRQPRLLVRSILAMAILMIAFVVAIASIFHREMGVTPGRFRAALA